METIMNWLDLRKIYERSKHREKRKKELRNEVERRFPHLSNRKYVIALAGDRKVEWRPNFIKRTGGLKADMQFECYDIATGEPVSTTVWWTYNGSKSKGDVKGSSGTLHLRAKFLIVTWKVKAWGNKTKDIVIFYYE
jgi:hypothetical protein